MMLDPTHVASGAFVGFIVGLTGVGGGSLMTPLLVLLFGVHPMTAVGTDLLYAAATKGVGSLIHGFRGSIAWRAVCLLAAGSVPTAAATLIFLSWLGRSSDASAKAITFALGCALLLTACLVLARKHLVEFRMRHASPSANCVDLLTIIAGAAMGFLVSITSVGAGAIGVTVLLLLFPHYATVRIVGTDIAHAVPLTLVAGAAHWFIGSVDGILLCSLLVGSVPAIVVGSYLAPKAPDRALRLLLAIVLTAAAVKLLAS